MPIGSFDEIYFTCLFLLGGYVSQLIVENEYPVADDSSTTKIVLRYLLFSLIIFAISYPIIQFLTSVFNIESEFGKLIISIIPLGITSCIIGYIRVRHIKYILKSNKVIKPLLSAWDRAFFDTDPVYIKLKLKNGDEMYGYLDSSSYISDSRRSDPDILFTLCCVDDNGNWEKQENDCILIMKSSIEYIRIINTQED